MSDSEGILIDNFGQMKWHLLTNGKAGAGTALYSWVSGVPCSRQQSLEERIAISLDPCPAYPNFARQAPCCSLFASGSDGYTIFNDWAFLPEWIEDQQ